MGLVILIKDTGKQIMNIIIIKIKIMIKKNLNIKLFIWI